LKANRAFSGPVATAREEIAAPLYCGNEQERSGMAA
jgi:hypothetical protein